MTGADVVAGNIYELAAGNFLGSGGAEQLSAAIVAAPQPQAPVAPRYAVIDLVMNMSPVKVTNSGYVLMEGISGYTRWHNGNPQLLVAPTTPSGYFNPGVSAKIESITSPWPGPEPGNAFGSLGTSGDGRIVGSSNPTFYQISDIRESGEVVGISDWEEMQFGGNWQVTDPATTGGLGSPYWCAINDTPLVSGYVGITVWTVDGTTNTTTDSDSLSWQGGTGIQPGILGFGGTGTWSLRSRLTPTPANPTGWATHLFKGESDQGVAANAALQDCNNTGDLLEDLPGTGQLFNGHSIGIQAVSVSNQPNPAPSAGAPVDYPLLSGSVGAEAYCAGLPTSDLGAGRAASANAATATVTVAGAPVVKAATQVIGSFTDKKGKPANLRELDPVTGLMGDPVDIQSLIPSTNGWSGFSPSGTPHAINDSDCIVGTATYAPPTLPSGTPPPSNPPTPGQHGVMLLPCQFSLLNGNQSGIDGAFFDGHRPTAYTDPDISSDNQTTAQDILDTGANLGPVNPGTGTGSYANSYVYNLLMTAEVNHVPGATYTWSRTYKNRFWVFNWDGTNWNVRQVRLGQTGFPPPPVVDTIDPCTTDVSSKGVLYASDSPGVPTGDADSEINVGDCAYQETIFYYSLQINLGSASTTSTIQVGQTLKLTKVQSLGDWRDFNNSARNFNIVSTTNVPDCTMTFKKAQNVLGTTGTNIILNSNINTGDE